jgi:hypothetical protein
LAPGVSNIDGLAVSTIPSLRQIVKAEEARPKKKVVFCTPTLSKPHPAFIESLKASIPLIVEAGWDEGATWQIGCAYISAARAMMTRTRLGREGRRDRVPRSRHVVGPARPAAADRDAGRCRRGDVSLQVRARGVHGPALPGAEAVSPMCREDGCVHMVCVPAGFLKVTRQAINKIIRAHPELCFGEESAPIVDLFQHGAHKGLWFGEDYAFCRRWNEMQEQVWVIPDLNITHHDKDVAFPGNYHRYLTELAQSEPDHAHV